ncbi:MAG: Crp/Fnr family transcriptional regulator [Ketobacter sp.]|nr:MAG: Crp/Fnr family transcriptional regulator [Ketobacter sp.]
MNGATKIDLVNAETFTPASHPESNAPCLNCRLSEYCLPALFAASSQTQRDHLLKSLVRQQEAHVLKRQYLFRQNDPFNTLYIVRSGAVKTVLLDSSGCEQITGFYYPGDLFGLDGINTHHYATTSMSLGNATVCAVDFPKLEKIITFVPSLQHHVFRMMAREIERNQRVMSILNHKTAEQRVAFLLLRYALHLRRMQHTTQEFTIPMSRKDMANHLGLAVETVSRILSRFQRLGLLEIRGRQVSAMNLAGLQEHFENGDQHSMQ